VLLLLLLALGRLRLGAEWHCSRHARPPWELLLGGFRSVVYMLLLLLVVVLLVAQACPCCCCSAVQAGSAAW
jgi:hypothetical protein